MKKYVFIAFLALATACMNSCKVSDCKCPEHHVQTETIDLHVKKSAWNFDNSLQAFYCRFDVEELTTKVYNYGEVSINHEYNSGTPDAYQVALPETLYKETVIGEQPYYFSEHIDYAYGVGFVEVMVTISDFYYEDFTPEEMYFRLQLTW